MKVTKLRTKKGNKLSKEMLESLAAALQKAIKTNGYESDARVINSSRIDISGHGCSFRIDPKVHGYNTKLNPFSNPRRTRTPTWDQRVHFNNLINRVLDSFLISGNIKSGLYKIREGMESFDEADWESDRPDHELQNESRGFLVEGYDYKLQ